MHNTSQTRNSTPQAQIIAQTVTSAELSESAAESAGAALDAEVKAFEALNQQMEGLMQVSTITTAAAAAATTTTTTTTTSQPVLRFWFLDAN